MNRSSYVNRLRSGIGLMLLLSGGCAPVSAPPRAPSVEGDDVRIHRLKEVPGLAPEAWAFVTHGLDKAGHPELVLLLKREATQSSDGPPSEAIEILKTLVKPIREGHLSGPWQMAGLPEGMFGRKDLTGIVVTPPNNDPRVPLAGPALSVLLMTKDEMDVASHFGAPRVANLLGHRYRYFPYPPWVDPKRPSVCSPEQMRSSPIAQVGRRKWIRGAGVSQDPRGKPNPVVLRLTRAAGAAVAKTLAGTSGDHATFFPLAPEEDADARLVWTKLGDKPVVITGARGMPDKVTGTFVVLASSDESAGAVLAEDGFSVFVPNARWAEFLTALTAGTSFELAGTGNDTSFVVTWATE
jgi:hypothetical protein